MRRLHPAQVALAVIAVLSLIALWDTVNRVIQNSSFSWSGEPSDDVIFEMALNTFSWVVAMPALGTAAAASALGLVLIWCLSPRPRGTRTMSAAGSTRNRAATTVANSPSISDASAAAPISTSTERE